MSVERSGAAGAVFLSYASQDAEAAKRICAALRDAGIEVWFDQSELRGGDAWDQKIRRQIKECTLFLPVVSAATQARREGYFRLEWKLADDRTHLMAKGTPFIMPVCIDDTKDWDAIVPDAFMTVQWTRLPGGETSARFCDRVKVLLAGEQRSEDSGQRSGDRGQRSEDRGQRSGERRQTSGNGGQRRLRRVPAWMWGAVAATVAVGGGLAGFRWLPRQVGAESQENLRHSAGQQNAATMSKAAAPAASEGVKLAQRARALYDKVGFSRDDMMLADDFAKRATDAEPTSAFCWGVRAHVQAAFLFRGFAVGDEFVQRARDAQSFANRAIALQADEVEALLAQGRVATYQRAYAQAEDIFGRALAAHPDDNRVRRALGTLLRYQPKRLAEALTVLQEAVRRDPRDALAHYDLAMGWRDAWNFSGSWAECDAALALQPFGSALLQKAALALAWKGEIAAVRAQLDQLTSADRTEDRAVFSAMLCGVLERSPEKTAAAAALTPREYLEDSAFAGPKAWFLALALQRDGKENLARAQWQAAETVLRERIRTDPKSGNYHLQLALTLAWLGRAEEASREIAPIEAAWGEQMNPQRARFLARHYAALGDGAKAAPYLRQAVNRSVVYTDQDMRFDPFLDKVRATPEFEALLTSLPKPPAPVMPAPYLDKATAAATAAAREAERLVAGVFTTLAKANYTRENLAVAEDLTRKATELAPDSARAWAARARVQASYVQRLWDTSETRLQATQADATRALALDPDEADAMIAQAMVTTSQGGSRQAEALLRRALELHPTDALVRRLLASALSNQGRSVESLAMSRETARLFPDDPMTHYDLGLRYLSARPPDAELALASFDAALAIESFGSAILSRVVILAGLKGDLAGARRALSRLSPTERSEDRAVGFAMWLGSLERNPGYVQGAAALSARAYFEDTYFREPKAWMLAHALRRDGKETFARLQWEAAEAVLRARLQAKPDDLQEKFRLWVTLAWLGRTNEIAADLATIDGVARESGNWAAQHSAARYYAGIGDAAKAVPLLRKLFNVRPTITDHTLPFDPWWDKLRGQPEFEALLAEAKARIGAK